MAEDLLKTFEQAEVGVSVRAGRERDEFHQEVEVTGAPSGPGQWRRTRIA